MLTFYTTQQLHKLYRQYALSSPVKLYNILKKDRLKVAHSKTLHKREKTVAQYDPLQLVGNVPYRTCVMLGQKCTHFSSKVYMDLMHIQGE